MTRDNFNTDDKPNVAAQNPATVLDGSKATPPPIDPSLSVAAPNKVVYQVIMDETYTLADDPLPTHTPPTAPLNTDADTQGMPTLTKTPKSEAFTDSNILRQSDQLLTPNDVLENDHTLPGTNIEHMDVAIKQWLVTLNWHRTSVAKPGLISKFKGHKLTLDLDLSCLLCNRYGEVIEQVWFKNMRDHAESIRHHGDEILGAKPILPDNIEADMVTSDTPPTEYSDSHDHGMNQESIALYLGKIPPHIFHVVMVLSSFTGHALSEAEAGYCELSDDEGNVILHIDLPTLPKSPTLWIATLTRVGATWRFNADLQPLDSYHMPEITQQISENLLRTAK